MVIVLALAMSACSGESKDEKASVKQNKETPGMIKKAPEGLGFYKTPTEVALSKPGEVIYSQVLSDLNPNMNGWRVLFTTTSIDGTIVPESALIYSPRDNKKHDIIAWAHGTVGMADACAPSRAKDGTKSIPYIDDYISKGYAVVAPDYEGLGTDGVHPFLVGKSEGRSILDAIRMADKFSPIKANAQAIVVGHSQGGQGSLFAGELQSTYAPDVKLLGTVAIAPAGELKELIAAASARAGTTGFVVMGAVGFSAAYKDVDISTVLTPDALTKSQVLGQGCLFSVIATYANDVGTTLLADPSTFEPWDTYLEENSPARIKSDVPVFIAQGMSDTTIPAIVTETMFNKACKLGTPGTRETYTGAGSDHSGVVKAAKKDVLNFVQDRFKGKEFISSC